MHYYIIIFFERFRKIKDIISKIIPYQDNQTQNPEAEKPKIKFFLFSFPGEKNINRQ